MIVIGLTGNIGSGKTTIAEYLVKTYGFTKLAFADELKRMLVRAGILTPDEVKEKTPYARKMLQLIGTELIRKQIDEDFWIKKLDEKIKYLIEEGRQRFVIDDVRFPNEAEYIHSLGGKIIRIKKETHLHDQDWALNHESEKYVDSIPADFEVINDGTLEELYEKVAGILKLIFHDCNITIEV